LNHRRSPSVAAILCAGLLSACSTLDIRRESYPDGARKAESSYLVRSDGSLVRHGIQTTWYREGERESMEIYVDGIIEGYAISWYPDGRLKSLEHFTDGAMDGQARHWDEAGTLIICRTSDGDACEGNDHDPSVFAARP
jgi:antitoxin component YwqK of YwqJK toxin-antitoxin module